MAEQMQSTTLANGLPVISTSAAESKTYNFFFLVGAGFRFEEAPTMGISRFLANSFFYGTQNLPSQEVLYEKMDVLGISTQTEVTAEYTFFNFTVLPEFLDESLQLFAEILTRPLFDPVNIATEAQITSTEIAQTGLNIQHKAFERVNQLIFSNCPLGFSSLGTNETIKNISKENLTGYYQKHYVAGNCLLAVTAPAGLEEIKPNLEKTLGLIPQGERQQFAPFDFTTASPRTESIPGQGKVSQFIFSWLCWPRGAQETSAQTLLSTILSYGRNNQFLGRLKKDKIIYSANSLVNVYSDCGVFSILASCENYRTKEAQDRVLQIVEEAKQQAVSEENITKAKNLYKLRIYLLAENVLQRSLFLATRIFFNTPSQDPETIVAEVDKLTPSDIQKTAETIFNPNGMFGVTAGGGFN